MKSTTSLSIFSPQTMPPASSCSRSLPAAGHGVAVLAERTPENRRSVSIACFSHVFSFIPHSVEVMSPGLQRRTRRLFHRVTLTNTAGKARCIDSIPSFITWFEHDAQVHAIPYQSGEGTCTRPITQRAAMKLGPCRKRGSRSFSEFTDQGMRIVSPCVSDVFAGIPCG